MDIQELLAKAFDIGNKTSFTVSFYDSNCEFIERKELTYTELGMYLINNNDNIKLIDIYHKE